MDYAQIIPGLFVGPHPRSVDEIERLRRDSAITAVLNLQTDDDMRAVKLDWPPLEAYYMTSGTAVSGKGGTGGASREAPGLRTRLGWPAKGWSRGLSPLHGWRRAVADAGHWLSPLAPRLGTR
jgi:hypothetical protein